MQDTSLFPFFDSFEEFVEHWGGYTFSESENSLLNEKYMAENTPFSHSHKFGNLLASLQGLSIMCQFDHPMLYLILNDIVAKGSNLNSLFLDACFERNNEEPLNSFEFRDIYRNFGIIAHRILFQSICEARNYISSQTDFKEH